MAAEDDPMSAEFDTVARWTAEVALDLGPEFHIPAGCRGSGNPHALDWLIDSLRLGPATRMVDIGAGVGGPAGYAQERCGVCPVLVEPEHGACLAASELFDLLVIRADATETPFADGIFDVAWCLGVLCTAAGPADQLRVLRELRRITVGSGRIGMLVVVAMTEPLSDPPEGNYFPTADVLDGLLAEAGLRVQARVDVQGLLDAPDAWTQRTGVIEHALKRRFGQRNQWTVAEEQAGKIGGLLARGELSAQLLHLLRW